jgi:DNA-directed RNA polymerase subunit RPC12/RpoP
VKFYVCSNCGQSVEKLTWRNSFQKGKSQCCKTCGSVYHETELTPEQKQKNDIKHKKAIVSRVFWFEIILGLIVLIIFGALLI